MSNHDPTLNALERLVGVIESIERRVQQLEKKSETQRAALLDAFRQINKNALILETSYLRIRKMEESINKAAPHPTADEPAVPPAEGEAGELSTKELEAQAAFADIRGEILSLSDGAEVNEVLGIIDNYTPE